MPLPIGTEHLILRRFTQADAPDLAAFIAHASVQRAVPEMEPTEAGIRRYIERQNSYQPFEQDKVFDLGAQTIEDNRLVGLLTLIRKEGGQGAMGWALGVDYRGQGYATEAARALLLYAFASLGLHRIEAEMSSANEPSWRLAERLGMRREGHLRQATVQDGQWLDTFVYGILYDEWQKRCDR